ncbi:hypothetical protein QBC40DRAFT_234371 [Triangularia verruculosa]|uniref:Uncharacterized protein n=1 Tax=Triangularia verruculosa TaxID=2587418 RepID=A0AAN7ARA6_9PEZI|nr:hypothetical protein QBC40DRAFT_234371 [Triangularia verruculosa]
MPIPKPQILRTSLTPLFRSSSARYVSSTLPRAMATATNDPRDPRDPRGGAPVEDIDLVFDYPTSQQASPNPHHPSLESSGLSASSISGGAYTGKGFDMDETITSTQETVEQVKDKMGNVMHKSKATMKRVDKEMGYPDNNVIYAGLGALALAALYVTLREPRVSEEVRRRNPTVDARGGMQNVKHDMPAHAPLENKVEKMIGRTG